MKGLQILPFAALAAAIVFPEPQVMQEIQFENPIRKQGGFLDRFRGKDNLVEELEHGAQDVFDSSKSLLDNAIESTLKTGEQVAGHCHDTASKAKAWIDSAGSAAEELNEYNGHHGHRGGHHHKPNLTVYELIAKSNYTKKLAALINEYDDLVDFLNTTTLNTTVFAPIDSAFEKIPEHAPKPSKEELKNLLLYHVSPDFYPAGRVLVTRTFPTLLNGDGIGGKKQRTSINISLKGLTLNFYSRIIAINIFGTNGVIHGIDSILVPPPKAATVVSLLPGVFSTLELGLHKTGLYEALNDTSTHVGGTVFAPSNDAFLKLGPKINAFLFSKFGLKYLKALLEYHVVANKTLYSDAYYHAEGDDKSEVEGIPKGYLHVDLPTLLKDKSLSVDVARYGRIIVIKINGFTTVKIEDGIVYDGVVHLLGNVLIPPKTEAGNVQYYNGEDLTVEELKARLAPFVDETAVDDVEL